MRRLPVVLAACSLVALAGGSARAQEAPADPLSAAQQQVAYLRSELAAARAQLSASQSILLAWNARLDRSQRAIWVAEQEVRVAALGPMRIDELGTGLARSRVARAILTEARERLTRVRDDPRAVAALATAQSASSLIGELSEALRVAREPVGVLALPGVMDPAAPEPDAGAWASLFLQYVGAPDCEENRIALVAWQAQEGTSASFNPLATTHDEPGATAFNDVGVRNFVTIGQGLEATAATLALPTESYGYAAVLQNLRACAPAETTAWFVNASAWCRGCIDGAYLTNLVPLVRADYASYAARV